MSVEVIRMVERGYGHAACMANAFADSGLIRAVPGEGARRQAMDALRRVLRTSFQDVLARIPEALKSEGFGVLTEIDVEETLKKKLGVDFRHYRILGACNPAFARQALDADLEIGRFMPCNIVVYEDDEHRTVVSAIDPIASMAAAGESPALRALAAIVQEKLVRAIARIE
jgi:uncharacterized protein (DUF302 family)